jgi:hypothetical protein
VSGRQVPRILLTLGAACLLVAAVVFLAVSWDQLGVSGRTGVLLGITAISAAATTWSGRRRLAAAFEAFGVVTLGLWSLDLFGAGAAGWVGSFDQSELLLGVGAALVVTSIPATIAVRTFARLEFRSGETFAVLGAASYATGLATFEQALVVALIGTIITAQAATAFRLPVAVAGSTAVSLSVWIGLVWRGTTLALETPGWHKLWLQGHGWPLMVAALLPWLPAFAQVLPRRTREILVGIGGIPLFLLVGIPTLNTTPTRMLLMGLAVLAGSALVVRVAPPPIGSGWAIPTSVAIVGGVALAVDYAGLGVERVAAAAESLYRGSPGGTVATMLIPERVPDPVFNGLLSLVLFVGVWVVAGRVLGSVPREVPGRPVTAVVASMAWLGAITLDSPVWTWVVSALALAAGFGADAAWRRRPLSAWTAAGSLTAAVVASLYSAPLNLLAAGTGVVVAALLALTARRHLVRGVFAAAATVLLADAIWAARWWTAGSGHPGSALFGICTVGALVVALAGPAGHSRTPAGWRPAWYGVGVGAALSWPTLTVGGIAAAANENRAPWLAAYLTAMGASLVASGLLARRHLPLVPPGVALLAVGSWVSLCDLGVGTPEAYTLPWAALLLALGVFRVLRRGGPSLGELAPGLALGLLPSLLWVFADPLSLRATILGFACLVLVLVGARARWSAPLVYAGVVGLTEVIRLAAPYAAQAIPRWALIGAAGALLVIIGVTWERRLAEARGAWRYLAKLR